jgi:hypothetical protein
MIGIMPIISPCLSDSSRPHKMIFYVYGPAKASRGSLQSVVLKPTHRWNENFSFIVAILCRRQNGLLWHNSSSRDDFS